MEYAADKNGKFCCPACGSTWFRTTNTSLEALSTGHPVACKDEYNRGCKWRGQMFPTPVRPA